jgi:hypothetical protein
MPALCSEKCALELLTADLRSATPLTPRKGCHSQEAWLKVLRRKNPPAFPVEHGGAAIEAILVVGAYALNLK